MYHQTIILRPGESITIRFRNRRYYEQVVRRRHRRRIRSIWVALLWLNQEQLNFKDLSHT